MVFTSPTFLFLFLPGVLAAFFITPPRLRTALLVAASWLFYAWGEKHLVVLLALSTVDQLGSRAHPRPGRCGTRSPPASHDRGRRQHRCPALLQVPNFLVLNVNDLLQSAGLGSIAHVPSTCQSASRSSPSRRSRTSSTCIDGRLPPIAIRSTSRSMFRSSLI